MAATVHQEFFHWGTDLWNKRGLMQRKENGFGLNNAPDSILSYDRILNCNSRLFFLGSTGTSGRGKQATYCHNVELRCLRKERPIGCFIAMNASWKQYFRSFSSAIPRSRDSA